MRVIKKTAIVPYSAAQMYDLVNDIESYPKYLPWCREAKVLRHSSSEIEASLHLARGGVHHTFSTVNRLQPKSSIEVQLLEGPFRHLKGSWRFEDIANQPVGEEGGCRVSFHLEFIFSNRILDMAVGPVLENIANTF